MNSDFIKQKLAQLNSSSAPQEEKQNFTWKPEPGSSQIRILPNIHNPDFPFTELYIYYNKFGKTFASPKSFGRPDPIVDFAKKLRNSKDEVSQRAAYSIEPTMRIFCMVLVRGKEHEGPKFWSFGRTVYASLLKFMDDPDYGDISNLNTGRDVVVEYALGKGKDINEQKKNSTTIIRVKPSITKAFTEPEIIEKIKAMKKPEDLFICPSESELKQMLENYLEGDNRQADNDKTSNYATNDMQKSSGSSKSKFNEADIDNMFAAFDKFEDKTKNDFSNDEVPF